MHHARWARFLAALTAAALTALCPRQISGQTQCSVEQKEFASWVTGRLTVGTVTASLTLPRFINRASYSMVLLTEVSAPREEQPEEELVIRSGYETVRIRDGAALHVVHRPSERLIFSVATLDGQELCSWEPPIVFPKKEYRIRNGLSASRSPIWSFHITGEPVGLVFQHPYSDGQQEFRLDGVPTRILMESPTLFLLRDPNPTAGVRTLESEGKAIPLHFVDAEKRLLPSSPNREVLEVTLRGLRLGPRQAALLFILNLNPQAARLACGTRAVRRELSEEVGLFISPLKLREGSITISCEVRLLQPKPAGLGEFTVQVVSTADLIPFPRL